MSGEKSRTAAFTALNLEEEDESAEEIREVQIEEAFQVFEKALKAHHSQEWELASSIYTELFQAEIFSTEIAGNVPHSLKSLKYLAYKNHGQLVLDWIKLSHQSLNIAELHDRLAQAVAEFAEAMIHESSNVEFWLQLARYMPALNLRRMTRYTLECSLSGPAQAVAEGDSDVSDTSLGLDDVVGLCSLKELLSSLGDASSLSSPVFQNLQHVKLDDAVQNYITKNTETPVWLQPLIHIEGTISEALANEEPQHINLVVNTRTWTSVGKTLLQLSIKTTPVDIFSEPIIITIKLPEATTSEIEFKEKPKQVEVEPQATDLDVMESDKSTGEVAADELVPEETCHSAATLDATTLEGGTSTAADASDEASRTRKRKITEVQGERSSKRVRARVEEDKTGAVEEDRDSAFFAQIDKIIAPYNTEFGQMNPASFLESEAVPSRDLALKDFLSQLQSWQEPNAKIFLYGEGIQNTTAGAMRLLDLVMFEESTKSKPNLHETEKLEAFTSRVNGSTLDLKEAVIEWLEALLLPDTTDYFAERMWPTALTKTTVKLILFYGDMIVNKVLESTKYGNEMDRYKYSQFCQSVFELFVNEYIENSQHNIGSEDSSPDLAQLRENIDQWRFLTFDLLCSVREETSSLARLRFDWVCIIDEQIMDAGHDRAVELLETFQTSLLKDNSEASLELPNTPYIPRMSAENVATQLSKLQAASLFAGIFQKSDESLSKKIEILEAVLLNADTTFSETIDLDIVRKFVDRSSLEFRLYIWSLLRTAYQQTNESAKGFRCALASLGLIIHDFSSDYYSSLSSERRVLTLFKCLYLARRLLSQATEMMANDELVAEIFAGIDVAPVVAFLVRLLRVLHTFVYHEDSLLSAGSSTESETTSYSKSKVKFREMLVQAWYLLYICVRKTVTDDSNPDASFILLRLLSLLHEELGIREYCTLSNFIFLRLVQNELLRFDMPLDTESELLQCIHCRFGLTLGTEYFYPYDHKAEPMVFDRTNALELVQFIMNLALRKRQSQGLPRSDMKTVLDKFCEVIGVPRRDQTAIYYNQSIIDRFLNQSLNHKVIRMAIRGQESLSTIRVHSDYAKVAIIGLYYLQGQIYLTQYRSRKRTMAGRTEDLDYAIRYFKHDLVCSTNRFESWFGLAQTYDAQAEDDMTWSAEKLNMDHKKSVVATQRRALLCYLLAMSIYLRHDTIEPPPQVLSGFFTDFGYGLYSSTRAPNDMEIYHMEDFEKYFSGAAGMYKQPSHVEVQPTGILKIALNMFEIAIKRDPKEWRNYYMLGKCLGKLERDEKLVLRAYIDAVSYIPEKTTSGDPIFEPHYKLISVIFKYFQSGTLDLDMAMSCLRLSHFYKDPDEEVTDSTGFYHLLIATLSRLRTADKKHWHHRPTYRIAIICDKALGDSERAKDEMASLFALKSAKSFISIWRPEFERAGRHFVYVYRYTSYYIDLLEQMKDLESLNLMAKKLRRQLTIMVKHTEIWEHLCKAIVQVLRILCDVPERYLETSMTSIQIDEFFTRAARLEFLCSKMSPPPPLVYYLQDASELRKLNAGLAQTTGMEDIFTSIYMKLYNQVPEFEREVKDKEQIESQQNAGGGGDVTDSSGVEMLGSPKLGATVTEFERNTPVPSLPGLTFVTESPAVVVAQVHVPGPRPRTARVTKKELISKANSLLKPLAAHVDSTAKDKEAKEKPLSDAKESEIGDADVKVDSDDELLTTAAN
ncbi:uncharacterized protein V1518DRAFT_417341 [Limtongia smithiae]|uniref:uncharacterized protein n=1 Tax=Limtongia smithiae TaxID=1125753 RepID=UPI0034CE7D63